MTDQAIVMIAAVIIALSLLGAQLISRYEIVQVQETAWRLDRVTGSVVMCFPRMNNPGRVTITCP